MKLIRSAEKISARKNTVECAMIIVRSVMPEGALALSYLTEDVTRIILCFQEKMGLLGKKHIHKDIALSEWPGTWGKFCTIIIDKQNARLQIWGQNYYEIFIQDLTTRRGKISFKAAVQDILLNKQQTARVLESEFLFLERAGHCCHDGILTISYQIVRKSGSDKIAKWEKINSLLALLDSLDHYRPRD